MASLWLIQVEFREIVQNLYDQRFLKIIRATMKNQHSPEGFYNYAKGFKIAAEIVIERQTPGLMVPVVYLLTHALELALKSFLMQKGVSEKTISRHPYGHDVVSCLEEAEKKGIFRPEALTNQQRKAIVIASGLFSKKELNYLYERDTEFPVIDELLSGLRAVMAAVFDHVSAPYFREMKCDRNDSEEGT